MSRNFHETYSEADLTPPSERGTGLVFAAVAAIVAIVFRGNPPVWISAAILACGFAGLSWLAPQLLGPLNRAWFRLSLLLSRIVTPVVMALLYAITIIPFGLAMQLFRDPLVRKRRPDGATYWIDRTASEEPASSMKNQF
jgi:hypothetical protein